MPAIKRQATFKAARSADAIVLEVGGRTIALRHAQLNGLTEAQIRGALQNAATVSGVSLPPIFIHINRDGSYALACGQAPTVWPEDTIDDHG